MRAKNDDSTIRAALSADEVNDLSIIELLFFSYRDFIADPDKQLETMGFGRAHHRVLYFVNRKPGMSVAELLDVLKITKQSLARVLKQLVDNGHIVQLTGEADRRQRELYPTASGRELILSLTKPQSNRIAAALAESNMSEKQIIQSFLKAMVNSDQRDQIDSLPLSR
ncbi:MarR family winged helix-turn-helix transcriptional regulator [Pseudochrobactrum sp. MP213Fo]|uniref:MarR family winged helix-turn-helix transcriptional regulator n=1 Tax=Pseudochrobactrum sp. MP213Fo TaxID=3022250 RepID=UPI003B9EEDFF